MSNNPVPEAENYTIPRKFRMMENLHIVFWLFKDLSWCMGTQFLFFRYLGITMIIPTLVIAIMIAWRTRNIQSELYHNLAVAVWIMANSYWMVSEFFHFDAMVITGDITCKHLAMIPFIIGILFLGYFYVWYKPRHKDGAGAM
jgi:hypothetical protein